jgi:pimeloyl-ACP methyl ester carboxylesterase
MTTENHALPGTVMSTGTHSRREFLRGALGFTAAGLGFPLLAAAEPQRPCVINENLRLRLPDGRCLGYAECGDPAGTRVVIHLHGLPSCRLEILIYYDVITNYPGLRILAPDRPGIGGSTPDPNASILNYPDELGIFADAMGVSRFALVAPSAGAPYALAAARAMPQRVLGVTLVGPTVPLELIGKRDGTAPRDVRRVEKLPNATALLMHRKIRSAEKHPEKHELSDLTASAPERALLFDPKHHADYQRIKIETFRQGPREVVNVIVQFSAPWAHWLGEVTTPVTILHGCLDKTVPARLAPILASRLPNAQVVLFEGEDHLSVPVLHPDAILDLAVKSL